MISFTLLVDGVDVSEYCVSNLSFTNTTGDNIPRGFFYLDDEEPLTITHGQDVDFYVSIDLGYKKFGGFIKRPIRDDKENRTYYECAGYAFKATTAEYTGRFRNDLGTGNAKTMFLSVVAEKFIDWTWDNTSFPDTDYVFISKSYQDKKCKEIFDEIAKNLNRSWWVDENKKLWCIERTYPEIVSSLVKGTNITGRIIHDVDDSKMGNVIKVLGARFPVHIQEEFVGTGTADEFVLDNFPSASTRVQYSTGVQVSTALEGVTDYNTGSVYDAYFKPDVPSIKFNNVTVVGGTVEVLYEITSQVREEIPVAASIEKYNYEKVKRIDNDKITSQEEAYTIAKNESETNAYCVDIFTVPCWPATQAQLEDWSVGNNALFTADSINQRYNIVENTVSWSKAGGMTYSVRLNDTPRRLGDQLADLLRRITQREERELLSGAAVIKTLYWGGNVYIAVENIGMDEQNANDGTFVMQDYNQDNRSLMGGTCIMRDDFTTSRTMMLVQNQDNNFVDRFLDDFYIESGSSNGTLAGGTYTIPASGTLQSRVFAKDGIDYSVATPTIEASGTAFSLWLKDASTSWETATSGTTHSFGTADEDLKYRIRNTGGTPLVVSKVEVSYS